MRQLVFGIDPGLSGGVAVLDPGGELREVIPMPTREKLHGKGQQVDGYELSGWLMEQRAGHPAVVYLEAVAAMPGQGVTSMFSFGEGFGIVQGTLQTMAIPYRLVTPGLWKRKAGLTGKTKDASRSLAQQLYPDHSDLFAKKKTDGLAEAVLIARFGQEVVK